MKIILGLTGSVATIKANQLYEALEDLGQITVVATEAAIHFLKTAPLPPHALLLKDDESEERMPRALELIKSSDILLIAPLDANTLAKIALGVCDNLLVRGWNLKNRFLVAPAMNTLMWSHPLTSQHLSVLQKWGVEVIPPVSKTLMCGDTGVGAMSSVSDIVGRVKN